jgi:hypothetical protein
LIPNPIRRVLSIFRKHQVRALLMGGQACVFYGAAQFSRDVDFALPCDDENLERLAAALDELAAECVAVPALAADYLRRGHAVHFRCHAPEVAQLRIDLLSTMRGVAPFPELWERRTTLADLAGECWDLLSIEDLVRAKKTQRDKDWPMIRALVEAHFARHHVRPQPSDVRFWLRESRSPEILRQCAAAHPDVHTALAAERPLLSLLTTGVDDLTLERALMEEELAERARDREYWRPLRAELERLRHQRR